MNYSSQFHTPPPQVWRMDAIEFLEDITILAEDSKKSNGVIMSKDSVSNIGLLMEQFNGSKRNPASNTQSQR